MVGREALDFLGREVGTVRRHDDGRAQAIVAIQPLGADPVVDRAAERGRQVLAEEDLGAMDHVADRPAGAEPVQQMGLHRLQAAAGRPGRQTPIGTAVDRGIGRVAAGFQVLPLQAAAQDVLPPVVVEIRQQHARVRDGWMDVAVDGAVKKIRGRTIHGRCFRLRLVATRE